MGLKISDYKLLCNKGSGNFNEDIIGLSPFGAWVLDGATGLNNKNLVSRESDSNWYVNWWNNYLHENMKRKKTIKEIVSNGIDEITKEYHKLLNESKVEQLDFPSASCAIIKFHEDGIEYLLLGDCTLFIDFEGETEILKDESICAFDKKVFDYMKQIDDFNNLTLVEKKERVMPIIVENRLKKNNVGGYWALEFSKEAIKNGVSGFIKAKDNMKIMMTSDGFSSGYDRYNIFDKKNLMKIAESKGIGYINEKIRELEKSDEMGIEFPRFKIHDDSSCIYLDTYKH